MLCEGKIFLPSYKNLNDPLELFYRWDEHPEDEIHCMVTEDFRRYFDSRDVGILSLSATYRDILMWSHYAEDHTGFCVGMKAAGIAEKYELKEVIYSSHPFEFRGDFTDLPFKFFYTKGLSWLYEEEYRVIIEDKSGTFLNPGTEVFDSLYFGLRTPENVKEQLIEGISGVRPDVEFWEMRMPSDKYELNVAVCKISE
jgi:hypothetical protein